MQASARELLNVQLNDLLGMDDALLAHPNVGAITRLYTLASDEFARPSTT